MIRQSTVESRQQLIDDLYGLMEERLGDPDLLIDDLAAAAFTSRRQAQRVFEERGRTFRSELRELRMAEAQRMLIQSPEITVREIARAVGYLQPAQFAKAFRRTYGRSPSTLRAEAQGLVVAAA